MQRYRRDGSAQSIKLQDETNNVKNDYDHVVNGFFLSLPIPLPLSLAHLVAFFLLLLSLWVHRYALDSQCVLHTCALRTVQTIDSLTDRTSFNMRAFVLFHFCFAFDDAAAAVAVVIIQCLLLRQHTAAYNATERQRKRAKSAMQWKSKSKGIINVRYMFTNIADRERESEWIEQIEKCTITRTIHMVARARAISFARTNADMLESIFVLCYFCLFQFTLPLCFSFSLSVRNKFKTPDLCVPFTAIYHAQRIPRLVHFPKPKIQKCTRREMRTERTSRNIPLDVEEWWNENKSTSIWCLSFATKYILMHVCTVHTQR